MSGFGERYASFDRFQQRHAWLGFPLAVRQKYSDDQGGYLAATIAYYGFFSIFPLLLVLVTVLGFVLHSNPGLQKQVVDSALGQFPVIGTQLRVHSLSGSGFALVVGIVGSLWAGTAVALATGNALDQLWGVRFRERPNVFRRRGKALVMLCLLGGGVVLSTLLAGAATATASYGIAARIGGVILSLLVNFLLFWAAYRVLASNSVGWRRLRIGAATAAALWGALQIGGTYIVSHQLKNAGDTYGTFAVVIGLLSWLYIGAHITLLAAEANIVAVNRLWPRSFSLIIERPPTEGDRRALRQKAELEERRQDQEVTVAFDETGPEAADRKPEATARREP